MFPWDKEPRADHKEPERKLNEREGVGDLGRDQLAIPPKMLILL